MARAHAVLVTGSSGWIGRAVSAELVARGHRVRGFDRVPSPALREAVVGDVASPDDLDRALADMDTAVHLAATPDEADFMTLLLPNNVIGLYRMLEAARHARLGRVILISSGQLYRGHDVAAQLVRAHEGPDRGGRPGLRGHPRLERGGDPSRLGAPRPRARRGARGQRPREGRLPESG